MNRLFFLLLIVFISGCKNDKTKYNDYFDLNLKNNPKKVQEFRFLIPDKILSNPEIFMFDSILKGFHFTTTLHFDSLGFIEYEMKDAHGDTMLFYEMLISNYEIKRNKDSIVKTEYFPSKQIKFQEKKILDKYGFPIKLTAYPSDYRVEYIRNNEHRIIKEKCYNTSTEYKYNSNNDILFERIFRVNDNCISKYEYLEYDLHQNWLLRKEFYQDTLRALTFRLIEY